MAILEQETIPFVSGTPENNSLIGRSLQWWEYRQSGANGLPSYDLVVLDVLYGEGKITKSARAAVLAGTKSIEDLGLTPQDLARLRCGEKAQLAYDEHWDPLLTPGIGSKHPNLVAAEFVANHAPTDRAHRVRLQTALAGLPTAATACRVSYARQYLDPDTLMPVAPMVHVGVAVGLGTFRAVNVDATGYDIYTDSGTAGSVSIELMIAVTPARRR